ncbi:MAG: histone deacetylase [Vicinamibacterales bacterium]
MSLVLIASERFADHQTPPGHPESPARAQVMDDVAGEWRAAGNLVTLPREVTHDELALVHDEAYLRQLAALAGRSAALDADTFTSPESIGIARLAAGAAVGAVELAMSERGTRALVLARPPGHHAERDRAMGFCFYNSISVAAAVARKAGAARVAIVDYDVHHGNGTQHIFEHDPAVLYVSVHQYPFYPGTGAAMEVGIGKGAGFTVNVPVEMGATDDDYRVVSEKVIIPVLMQFKPELLLVSAGFDAHERDPLGNMRVTTEGFGAMTMDLCRVADECCDGRLVALLEGGYDLDALRACAMCVTDVLSGRPAPAWPTSGLKSSRGETSVKQTMAAQAAYWKL